MFNNAVKGKRKRDNEIESAIMKKQKVATTSSVKNMIARAIRKNTELKYFDTTLSSIAADYTGICYPLNGVPQGDTDSTRDGDKLTPHGLKLKFGMFDAPSVTTTNNTVRVIIGLWHPTISGAPAISDILNITGNAFAPYSHYTWDKRAMWTCLKDIMLPVGDYAGNPASRVFNLYFDLSKKKQSAFVAGSSTNFSEKLFFLAVSDQVSTNIPTVAFVSRFTYTDA
jgi:hypothetical protein